MNNDTIDCPNCGITNPSFELWCFACDAELHPIPPISKEELVKRHVIKEV